MNGVGRFFALIHTRVVGRHHALRDRRLVLENKVILIVDLGVPISRGLDLSEVGDLRRHDVERQVHAGLRRAADQIIVNRRHFQSIPDTHSAPRAVGRDRRAKRFLLMPPGSVLSRFQLVFVLV